MTTITKLSQLDLNKSYTYADYLMWQLLPKAIWRHRRASPSYAFPLKPYSINYGKIKLHHTPRLERLGSRTQIFVERRTPESHASGVRCGSIG